MYRERSSEVGPKGEVTQATTASLPERIRRVLTALVVGLIERGTAVRLALLAALAGEHTLLIGPPGTAKSEIARRLRHAFREGSYYERLLTRFSVPEELFGPFSLAALEDDRYVRQTKGYLPEATVGFVDEIFKANSAILNALLTLLNERQFDNGNERHDVPLAAVIGASNELPEGPELDALFDRFLVRQTVGSVSDEGFAALLALDGDREVAVEAEDAFSEADLAGIRKAAERVELPEEVAELLAALRKQLQADDVFVSDRRWRKIVKLLKVSARTNGRDRVSIWDAWLLPFCTWSEPGEFEAVRAWYHERVGVTDPAEPERLQRLVVAVEGLLERERDSQSQACDEDGRLLYVDADGEPTPDAGEVHLKNGDGKRLYLGPPQLDDRTNGGKGYTYKELKSAQFSQQHYSDDWQIRVERRWENLKSYTQRKENQLRRSAAPLVAPTRYSRHHRDGRVAEARELLEAVRAQLGRLEALRDETEEVVRDHLWVDDSFAPGAASAITAQIEKLRPYATRAEALVEGFSDLPVHEELQTHTARPTSSERHEDEVDS